MTKNKNINFDLMAQMFLGSCFQRDLHGDQVFSCAQTISKAGGIGGCEICSLSKPIMKVPQNKIQSHKKIVNLHGGARNPRHLMGLPEICPFSEFLCFSLSFSQSSQFLMTTQAPQ